MMKEEEAKVRIFADFAKVVIISGSEKIDGKRRRGEGTGESWVVVVSEKKGQVGHSDSSSPLSTTLTSHPTPTRRSCGHAALVAMAFSVKSRIQPS
jgi:hypothetical protein